VSIGFSFDRVLFSQNFCSRRALIEDTVHIGDMLGDKAVDGWAGHVCVNGWHGITTVGGAPRVDANLLAAIGERSARVTVARVLALDAASTKFARMGFSFVRE
jgi:hypothetical protein